MECFSVVGYPTSCPHPRRSCAYRTTSIPTLRKVRSGLHRRTGLAFVINCHRRRALALSCPEETDACSIAFSQGAIPSRSTQEPYPRGFLRAILTTGLASTSCGWTPNDDQSRSEPPRGFSLDGQHMNTSIERIAPPPNNCIEPTWQLGTRLAKRRARRAPSCHAAHARRYAV
jgi:hypothetical protein